MEIEHEFDAFEDDLEVIELVEVGIPRQIYIRSDYFHELSDLKFRQRFRLMKETVLNLLIQIEDQLEFPVDKNDAVSPINQLLTALRFYSTGGHLSTIADYMGIHISTASRIIQRVSRVIASKYNDYVKMPEIDIQRREIQNEFYNIARFPRVVGALDCTHVKIESPGGDNAEVFRNRKDYFSINVQGICNSNLEFLNVVARWPGSAHDVTIFNNSIVRQQFEEGLYPNCILLGDSGYNVRPYLFTPLLNPNTRGEQLYNEAHIRSRNTIERAFGVWKRRFPVLAYGIRLKLDTTLAVITACAVLHNIARKMGEDDPPLPDEINNHQLQRLIEEGQIPVAGIDDARGGNNNIAAQLRRNFITNFFGNF